MVLAKSRRFNKRSPSLLPVWDCSRAETCSRMTGEYTRLRERKFANRQDQHREKKECRLGTGTPMNSSKTGQLRDVVTERGEKHVVDPMRRTAIAHPRVANHVGVLRAELQSSVRPLVNAIPESDGAFD